VAILLKGAFYFSFLKQLKLLKKRKTSLFGFFYNGACDIVAPEV
jgi:hypothetical protein